MSATPTKTTTSGSISISSTTAIRLTGRTSETQQIPEDRQRALISKLERDSDEELRLQLEATTRLADEDRQLVKRFINGLLLSHEAKRLAA